MPGDDARRRRPPAEGDAPAMNSKEETRAKAPGHGRMDGGGSAW